MMDAGPSLRAAARLSTSALTTYLESTGWTIRPSRVRDVTIFVKTLLGAEEPVHILLPQLPEIEDERLRIADALRTIEAVEERPLSAIADEVSRIPNETNAVTRRSSQISHRPTAVEIKADRRPVFVLSSTAASVKHGIPSLLAAAEVVVAVSFYWAIALAFETQAHLWMSVVVAPLLLLRSDASVALGIRWFEQFVHYGFSQTPGEAIRKVQLWIAVALAAAAVPILTLLLAHFLLNGTEPWRAVGLGFLIAYLVTQAGTAIVLGIAANELGVLLASRPLTIAIGTAAVAAISLGVIFSDSEILPTVMVITTAIALGIAGVRGAPIVARTITLSRLSSQGEARGVTAALAIIETAPHLFAIFAPGAFVGAWLRSVVIRVVATACHPLAGLVALPDNWWRTVFVIDSRHPPEIVPGYTRPDLLRPSYLLDEVKDVKNPVVWFVYSIAFIVMFAPAYLYRLSIKSTCWAYLPLVYCSRPLRLAHNPQLLSHILWRDPKEWMRRLLLGLTSLGVLAAILPLSENAKLLLSAAAESPLGFMFLVSLDDIKPWVWLPLADALLTLLLFICATQLRVALHATHAETAARRSRKSAVRIEYLMRLRNICTWLWFMLILLHSLLLFSTTRQYVPPYLFKLLRTFYGDALAI